MNRAERRRLAKGIPLESVVLEEKTLKQEDKTYINVQRGLLLLLIFIAVFVAYILFSIN